jgi:hypothetical protein
MKQILSISIILFYTGGLFSQNDSDKTVINSSEPRNFFINSSLGILEFISLGVGYQASEKVAITIKASETFITGASLGFPNWGTGLGFKVSYSTEFLLFNTISAEYIAYLETSIDESNSLNTLLKGNYFDFNIGRENIYDEGLNVFWAIGICISAVKTTDVLYSPSLKVGLNYNFH